MGNKKAKSLQNEHLRLNAGALGSHLCCRAVPSLGTRCSGREEMLLTLYLTHMSFNPSWNGWCPLKGRAISLAGAKKLSPSEMPHSLSIYNSRGRHRPCTGKRQAQWEGGNWVVVIQRLEKFWVIPVLSPAKITLHKSASLLFRG